MIATSIILHFVKLAGKILSGILFLLLVLASYSGNISPRIFAFPSTIVLALPYLAWGTIVVGIIWIFFRCYSMAAGAVIALLISWGGVSNAAIPMGKSKSAEEGEKTFTLLTYNITNGKDMRDSVYSGNRTWEYILHSGADIVCLQETSGLVPSPDLHISAELVDSLEKAYPYRAMESSNVVGLLSKYPFTMAGKTDLSASGYIHALYDVDLDGMTLHILNVHLTSFMLTHEEREIVSDMKSVDGMKESLKELKDGNIRQKLDASFRARALDAVQIREWIDGVKGPLIVVGDFNDVPQSWVYREVKGEDLKDAYNETSFVSIPTFNDHYFYFHIDQLLYRPTDGLRALESSRGNLKSSDHYPLLFKFAY